MIRTKDFTEGSWGAGRPYLVMGSWLGDRGSYRQGVYRHSAGVVEVYEQVGSHPMLSLRFRWRGRDHYRRWDTTWGDKTIARLSREFIEDKIKEWADDLALQARRT